jgi:hypothetical protein
METPVVPVNPCPRISTCHPTLPEPRTKFTNGPRPVATLKTQYKRPLTRRHCPCFFFRRSLTPFSDALLIFQKRSEHFHADRCSILHLLTCPLAHPQNPLKFFGRIKPTSTITKTVSRKIVTEFVFPAGPREREHDRLQTCFLLSRRHRDGIGHQSFRARRPVARGSMTVGGVDEETVSVLREEPLAD